MIKVFTLNKNNKIELTEKELKQLLDEAYWEGYRNNYGSFWTYTSPSVITPYYCTVTNTTTGTTTLTGSTTDTISSNYNK